MKTKSDPRHLKRVKVMKTLFKKILRPNIRLSRQTVAFQIITHQKAIDKLISQNAPAWPIDQVNPVDLATLRLAIWELLFKNPKEPYKVVIDEAVELAKEFGTDTSSSFVNGVLGSIVKSKISYG